MTILVGNQRGGAKNLALHLMSPENDHVEVHEIRGCVSDTVMGALNEIYALSKGTKARKFLYSLSANPPKNQTVTTDMLLEDIEKVEKELGLEGQARVIVFHEKKGRRHAHCVWSRIDTANMRAIHIPYDRKRLVALTRDIIIERDWPLPKGLIDKKLRDPKQYNYAEYQRAKRLNIDPKAIKTAVQDAWSVADTKTAFKHALAERGLTLARGNKGRFVVLDHRMEIFAVTRCINKRAKALRERLGDGNDLPDVEQAKAHITQNMQRIISRLSDDIKGRVDNKLKGFEKRKSILVKQQGAERSALKSKQDKRWNAENILRQQRFRKGMSGLWDRVRGEHSRIQKQNEREALDGLLRDRREADDMVLRHIQARRQIEIFKLRYNRTATSMRRSLKRDFESLGADSKRTTLKPIHKPDLSL